MDAGFKKWLNTTVQRQPFISQDGAGDATLGVSEPLVCYTEGSARLIINASGEEVSSTKVLYVDGDVSIHLKDIIVVDGRKYPILQAIPYQSERGIVELTEVFL